MPKKPNFPEKQPKIPNIPVVPEKAERAITLDEVLDNIRDPKHWIHPKPLRRLIMENPSLRGIIYGYVAEAAFVNFLDDLKVSDHFKPDDHKKTKSDRTFDYKGRRYTIQLKSLQTNSIREVEKGNFRGKVQNDASDRRKLTLADGTRIETTCYRAGEYDILGVSLQPFVGTWRFAFKKNRDLKHSTYKKYPPEVQKVLLATLEDISFPLTPDWTEDLLSLLKHPRLGTPVVLPL
jgi:hypothetical protein